MCGPAPRGVEEEGCMGGLHRDRGYGLAPVGCGGRGLWAVSDLLCWGLGLAVGRGVGVNCRLHLAQGPEDEHPGLVHRLKALGGSAQGLVMLCDV